MKIIKPSYEIIDTLNEPNILKKIEVCGRVCYKSEARITENSAIPFCNNILKSEHESVVEHGEYILQFKNPNDYSKITHSAKVIEEETGKKSLLRFTVSKERYIISGNVRMWRDFIKSCVKNNIYICKKALTLLTYVFDIASKSEFKTLFGDILDVPSKYEINPFHVKFLTPDDLITDVEILTHRIITVKFTTDRGISHEIVRHRPASYSQESTRYCNYSNDKFDNEITVVKPCQIAAQESDWRKACEVAEEQYFKLLETTTPQTARAVLPTCLKTELIMTANLREWRHFFNLRTVKAAHPDMRALTIPLLKELKQLIPVVFDDIYEEVTNND